MSHLEKLVLRVPEALRLWAPCFVAASAAQQTYFLTKKKGRHGVTVASSGPCLLPSSGRSAAAVPTPQGCPVRAVRSTTPGSLPPPFSLQGPDPFPNAQRTEGTRVARATLTSAPESGARYSLRCDSGTALAARRSGESILLATNPGVEPRDLSGAALPSLLALAAPQKTRRGGVGAAGSSARRRRRRGARRSGTGRVRRAEHAQCAAGGGARPAPHLPGPGGSEGPVSLRAKLGKGVSPEPQAPEDVQHGSRAGVQRTCCFKMGNTAKRCRLPLQPVYRGTRRRDLPGYPNLWPPGDSEFGGSLRRPGQGNKHFCFGAENCRV